MNENMLDFKNSYIASCLFLNNLYDKYDGLSEKDRDEFGALMSVAFCPMGWTVDWQRGLTKFYGREIKAADILSIQISPTDTFVAILLYITMFQEQFGFPCQFLIDILNEMLNSPDKFEEWETWENAIKNVLTGNYEIERSMWD